MMRALTEYELQQLVEFRAEVKRGLLHADWWIADMKRLQVRFDTVCELRLCGELVEEE